MAHPTSYGPLQVGAEVEAAEAARALALTKRPAWVVAKEAALRQNKYNTLLELQRLPLPLITDPNPNTHPNPNPDPTPNKVQHAAAAAYGARLQVRSRHGSEALKGDAAGRSCE